MKKTAKHLVYFFSLLFVVSTVIPFYMNYSVISPKDKYNEITDVRNSAYWKFTGVPITINGSATGVDANNWTWAQSQPWCSGSGTWDDPYIIENVTIDCDGLNYGIFINDSDVYFRIQNCTIYGSGYDYNNGAIRLWGVNNGTIYNNTLSSSAHGVYINVGNNITISENIITNNSGEGIDCSSAVNVTMIGNTFENNGGGIQLTGGSHNTIFGNTISGVSGIRMGPISDYNNITGNTINSINSSGIYMANCEGNVIDGNEINYGYNGIELLHSSENNFTNNIVNHSKHYGLGISGNSRDNIFTDNSMVYCGLGISPNFYQIVDSTNTVNSRPIYHYINETGLTADKFTNAGQVILINCNNSVISNVNASFGSTGISFYLSENNTVTGSDISNNIFNGINIDKGAYNKFLNNTVNNNGLRWDGGGFEISWSPHTYLYNNTVTNSFRSGMRLSMCNESSVLDNTVNSNGRHAGEGIEIYESPDSEVKGNIVKNNSRSGIYIWEDLTKPNSTTHNNCSVSNNFVYGNQFGILINSEYNNITGNTVSHNTDYGFQTESDHNEFSENIASYNTKSGFYFLRACFNKIINNTISHNVYRGIHFLESRNNTVLENRILYNGNYGIHGDKGGNYTISDNILSHNSDAIFLEKCDNIEVSDNVMNNNGNGVYLYELNNSKITGNTIDMNMGSGISLQICEHALISDNTVSFNGNGIYIGDSTDVTASNNDVTNNNLGSGFSLSMSSDIEILNNIASYNEYGVNMGDSNTVIITGNTFNNNSLDGIYMSNGMNNEITGNTINNNTQYGIWLDVSSDNVVTGNTLLWNLDCIVETFIGSNIITNNICENRPTPPTGNGDGEEIPGYNIFLLIIITTALTAFIFRKRRNKFKF